MTRMMINAAMVPNEGTFTYRGVCSDVAAGWLREHGREAVSYVGYTQTAEHIRRLSGVEITLNRAKCTMSAGDEALVVKLAYRVADPATKGQPQPDDWEYGILTCDVVPQPTSASPDVLLQKLSSTNGRWGIEVIGPPALKPERWALPRCLVGYRADVLGETAGVEVVRLAPEPGSVTIIESRDQVAPVAGEATVVASMSLQSGHYATVISARPGAVLRWVGYKGRSAGFERVTGEGLREMASHEALAMGIS